MTLDHARCAPLRRRAGHGGHGGCARQFYPSYPRRGWRDCDVGCIFPPSLVCDDVVRTTSNVCNHFSDILFAISETRSDCCAWPLTPTAYHPALLLVTGNAQDATSTGVCYRCAPSSSRSSHAKRVLTSCSDVLYNMKCCTWLSFSKILNCMVE